MAGRRTAREVLDDELALWRGHRRLGHRYTGKHALRILDHPADVSGGATLPHIRERWRAVAAVALELMASKTRKLPVEQHPGVLALHGGQGRKLCGESRGEQNQKQHAHGRQFYAQNVIFGTAETCACGRARTVR